MMKPKTMIIALIGCLCLLIITYFGVKIYFEKSLDKEIEKEIANISSFAHITYEDIRVEPIGKRISVAEITIVLQKLGEPVTIEEAMFYEEDTEQEGVKETHVKLSGIRLKEDGGLMSHLKKMGYSTANASITGRFIYDPNNRNLNIKQFTIKDIHMGEATLKFHAQNINLSGIDKIPENIVLLLAKLSGIKIVGAELNYSDYSLLGNLYRLGASQSNKSVEQFLKEATDQIDSLFVEHNDPGTQSLLNRLHKFILSPDKITIRIKPLKPVPVVRLFFLDDPGEAVDILGLSIET
jgi:hypothetical protein